MDKRNFRIPLVVGTPALAASLMLPVDAQAKKEEESACEKIKPEQRLSEERQQELQSAIDGAITGLGRASADVDAASDSKVNIQVLSEDALAKSWFVYQTCVMKEAGLLDDETAQSLVRELMGLEPTQVTVTMSDQGGESTGATARSTPDASTSSGDADAGGGSKKWIWIVLGALVVAGAAVGIAIAFSGEDGLGPGGVDDTGFFGSGSDFGGGTYGSDFGGY